MESLDHAEARGAEILGELTGYGATDDAFHITQPAEGGAGAVKAIQLALNDAGAVPSDIDYINAHGTSTAADATETQAIKTVFKDHAKKLSVSSTKSMTGHLLGAAGGVEAIYSLMAIKNRALPPTINYTTPDPECDLDYVPNQAREANVDICISNSFGFGGTNGVLVFKKFSG